MAPKSSRGNGRQRTRNKQNQNLLLSGTTVGVDWDKTGWWANGTGKPEDTVRFPSMEVLFESLPPGTPVVVESTFESFDLLKKEFLLRLAELMGWKLRTISPRRTARRRAKLHWKKSNKVDAAVIYRIAEESREHQKDPHIKPDPRLIALRQSVASKLRDLRNGVQGFGYETLTKHSEEIWGGQAIPRNGQTIPLPLSSEHIKATVILCAMAAKNKEEFEKLLGLYSHGYPSQMRSNINRRYWYLHKKYGMDWPEFRREIRKSFRKVKEWQERHKQPQIVNYVMGKGDPLLPPDSGHE